MYWCMPHPPELGRFLNRANNRRTIQFFVFECVSAPGCSGAASWRENHATGIGLSGTVFASRDPSRGPEDCRIAAGTNNVKNGLKPAPPLLAPRWIIYLSRFDPPVSRPFLQIVVGL